MRACYHGTHPLLNAVIVEVRTMTGEEVRRECWKGIGAPLPIVLVLSNGVRLYPAQDAEGNGPGALFGIEADGSPVMFPPPPGTPARWHSITPHASACQCADCRIAREDNIDALAGGES